MSITPIRHSVDVKAPPARAFDLFASNMGTWWPRGRTPAPNPHVAIIIEPRAGGRWFERDAQGKESRWGTVLDWDPPRRLLLGWQLNHEFRYDATLLTEVELSFAPLPTVGTRVSLEHRDLERFGADAETVAGKIRSGWPTMLGHYEHYTAEQS